MKNLPEEILWHIHRDEEDNYLEALYIHSLIEFARKGTKEEYHQILDVGCGNGRIHPYLREFGYEVWGIDVNKELMELAKKRNKGYEKYYIVADMRNFSLNREFDIILCWFTTFGYFSDKENIRVLENFYKHCRRKGILILDIPTEDFLTRPLSANTHEFENFIHVSYSWTEGLYRIFLDEIWEGKKKIYERKVKVRIYPMKLMEKILKSAGFEVIGEFERRRLMKFRQGACVYLCVKR